VSNCNGKFILAAVIVFSIHVAAFGQIAPNRFALILEDPPVSAKATSREEMLNSTASRNYRQQIAARQQSIRTELASRKIQVTSSADTVMNAIFVIAPKERVAELAAIPGVKAVVPVRRYQRKLNAANQLVNAPAAWNLAGGIQNAGKGIKIAILDSGIDQTHPAFQDSSLPMPSGYPICSGSDCQFTNNKVIVARSYVSLLAAGTDPSNPALDSRPDDYSARDRDGHGTAVASCAAGNPATGLVTINGVAPKAYLGNYKIYGSPQVKDSTTDDIIVTALDDAVKDGMDIVNFSSGGPAFTGPLDTGAVCGNPAGVTCDLSASAFEAASKAGLIIVAAAGNEGEDGVNYPTFNSISSPADAPSVIAVGGVTNSHIFAETVSVPGESSLQNIAVSSGDAYVPTGAITAPLRDVVSLGNDGLACSAFPFGSLTGTIALILRGTCTFSDKANNALNAGALGVILYMADSSTLVSPSGLSSTPIPVVMISNADGTSLKSYLAAHPGHNVTIDPAGIEETASNPNQVLGFSSVGPSTGSSLIKPDLLAVGGNENVTGSMYMAAETYDPYGIIYSSNGYGVADGTSFATPMTAGAAALVKQAHPSFTAAQVKSALVNSAAQSVTTDDSSPPATVDVQSTGAGRLDVGAAVGATVLFDPPTLSFGVLQAGSLPVARQLTITNNGSSAVNLSFTVAPGPLSPNARPSIDKQTLTLAPNASGTVSMTVSGTLPAAGEYAGFLTIQGASSTLHVPYQYLVGSGVPANLIPLSGDNFDGTVGQGIPDGILAFKLVDAAGVPVSGAPVTWTARNGGAIVAADSATDQYGIATAQPQLGTQPGTYSFTAVSGTRYTFSGYARPVPTMSSSGVANAASGDATKPVAPGSYISIFGSGLSDFTDGAQTSRLPLSIDLATVSFDVPSARLSVPGHLTYASPNQVNVQVPWELQGQSAAQVKVTIDYSNGNVVTVPLADYSPAFFEIGTGVAAALDSNFQVIGASNPAKRGQTVQLYANGLGPVTNQPASGDPAPASPLAMTKSQPVVSIGGQQAAISFSGLAPGFAGLYQINVTVPQNLTPGNQPITVSIGGQTSKQSGLMVQ
jgi:minor extracellular serine protease Vpr